MAPGPSSRPPEPFCDGAERPRGVSERTYTEPDGRVWTFRRRPEVRHEEAATHVTLLVESLGSTRVVSCRRSEWELPQPDLAGLLARAVPIGASRGIGTEPDPHRP
jgi:hypothetical protein